MKQAHDLYINSKEEMTRRPIIAYMIDYEEANVCDQKIIENALFSKYNLRCRRLNFEDVTVWIIVLIFMFLIVKTNMKKY